MVPTTQRRTPKMISLRQTEVKDRDFDLYTYTKYHAIVDEFPSMKEEQIFTFTVIWSEKRLLRSNRRSDTQSHH